MVPKRHPLQGIPWLKAREQIGRERRSLKTLGPRVATQDVRLTDKDRQFNRFYASEAWMELRDRVRLEAGGRCEKCGRSDGRMTVDHKHELKDGGDPLDRRGVWLLCSPCNGAKTAREAMRRAADGQD